MDPYTSFFTLPAVNRNPKRNAGLFYLQSLFEKVALDESSRILGLLTRRYPAHDLDLKRTLQQPWLHQARQDKGFCPYGSGNGGTMLYTLYYGGSMTKPNTLRKRGAQEATKLNSQIQHARRTRATGILLEGISTYLLLLAI
jgi:hypothetical protein